jgi:hypothetical protein
MSIIVSFSGYGYLDNLTFLVHLADGHGAMEGDSFRKKSENEGTNTPALTPCDVNCS